MASPEVEMAKVAAEQGPFTVQNIIPTLWMALISAAGGFMGFYGKYKAGKVRAFNITELIGEVFVSVSVGLVTYWICKGFQVNEWLTAAGVAISGHMGARAIFLLENTIEKKADTWSKS
jgi:hypothetical protein